MIMQIDTLYESGKQSTQTFDIPDERVDNFIRAKLYVMRRMSRIVWWQIVKGGVVIAESKD